MALEYTLKEEGQPGTLDWKLYFGMLTPACIPQIQMQIGVKM
jgi:hypothetical protein